MSDMTPEGILARHGWACPLERFLLILDARIHRECDIEWRGPTHGQPSDDEEDKGGRGPGIPISREIVQARLDYSIPREIWGPRQRTVVYFVDDSAIPSFLQSSLPLTLPEEDEQEELETLKASLRRIYETRLRGSLHGSWIAINAVGEEDDQGRFSIIGGGHWDGHSTHADFQMTVNKVLGPLPASPVRDRAQAGCFEAIMDQEGHSDLSFFPAFLL